MKITIEVNNDEEYLLALLKCVPSLGEIGNSTVEIIYKSLPEEFDERQLSTEM